MSAWLTLAGFEEYREALRHLPEHLAQEAATIVTGHAEKAGAAVKAAYPLGETGNLRNGVKVQPATVSGAGASAQVRSTARIASIVENGTQVRHTELGWNRGRMPPGHFFVPVMVRERRAMQEDLIALVQREGFTVSGG